MFKQKHLRRQSQGQALLDYAIAVTFVGLLLTIVTSINTGLKSRGAQTRSELATSSQKDYFNKQSADYYFQ